MDRTVFPSPNGVIVLEIPPDSLLKETTGWGGGSEAVSPAWSLLLSCCFFLPPPWPAPTFYLPPTNPQNSTLFLGSGWGEGWWRGRQPCHVVGLEEPALPCCPPGTVRKEFGVWTSLSDWD